MPGSLLSTLPGQSGQITRLKVACGARPAGDSSIGRPRHPVRPQNQQRVLGSRHHREGEPVELETERNVIGMDSLEAAPRVPRQPGGSAGLRGTAEGMRPHPSRLRRLCPRCTEHRQGLRRPVRPHPSPRTSHCRTRALARAGLSPQPLRSWRTKPVTPPWPRERPPSRTWSFCTTVLPPRSADRSRPGELTASNPGAGGPSLRVTQSGWPALSASASSSVPARTTFPAPRAKARAAAVKARMTSMTTATDGAPGQVGDADEAGLHAAHDPTPARRRVLAGTLPACSCRAA
jgi:hypothetical protein